MKRRNLIKGALGCSVLASTEGSGAADSKSLTVPEQKVPVVEEVDVCVLGGSCTGVFAAVRAAQLGARVAIVEKQNAFGGVAASGLVNMWHTHFDKGGKRRIINGLTGEIVDKLKKMGACLGKPESNQQLNTEELKIELDKLVLEHKVAPYLHCFYSAPFMEGTCVKAVLIETKSGRRAIRAKAFVDATGDGDLAKDACIPFEIRDGLQPPTTCAKIAGMPSNHRRLITRYSDEFGLEKDHGWNAAIPGAPYARMYASIHVFDTVASDARQLTDAEIRGRLKIRAIMDIARKYGGKNVNPCLLSLPSYIGIRETRSFKARYTLKAEDLLKGRRFDDAIANGTYPIDIHDPRTGRFKFRRIRCDFYQIPFSTMVSEKADNVIMSGRMISADRGAFGAIRVMVNLNQTGEAAGVAAALAVQQKKAVYALDAADVRRRLKQLGAIII